MLSCSDEHRIRSDDRFLSKSRLCRPAVLSRRPDRGLSKRLVDGFVDAGSRFVEVSDLSGGLFIEISHSRNMSLFAELSLSTKRRLAGFEKCRSRRCAAFIETPFSTKRFHIGALQVLPIFAHRGKIKKKPLFSAQNRNFGTGLYKMKVLQGRVFVN